MQRKEGVNLSKNKKMGSDEKPKPTFKVSLTDQNIQNQQRQPPQQVLYQQQEEELVNGEENVVVNDEALHVNEKKRKELQVFFEELPPGYRFKPSDGELVTHYLRRKIDHHELPLNVINDVVLYKYNPQHLADSFPNSGDEEWLFFTPRDRKYKNGKRPNRAAGDGYWKATGADKEVKDDNKEVIGYRKSLVFYKGKPPRGEKTNWIMHEYRVKEEEEEEAPKGTKDAKGRRAADDMRLDDCVLCRLYKKNSRPRGRRGYGNAEPDEEKSEDPRTSAATATSFPSSPAVVNGPNASAAQEMNHCYNAIGGSNGFLANPLLTNRPQQMPYRRGGVLVPAEMPQCINPPPFVPDYHHQFNASHHIQQPMGFNPINLVSSYNPLFPAVHQRMNVGMPSQSYNTLPSAAAVYPRTNNMPGQSYVPLPPAAVHPRTNNMPGQSYNPLPPAAVHPRTYNMPGQSYNPLPPAVYPRMNNMPGQSYNPLPPPAVHPRGNIDMPGHCMKEEEDWISIPDRFYFSESGSNNGSQFNDLGSNSYMDQFDIEFNNYMLADNESDECETDPSLP